MFSHPAAGKSPLDCAVGWARLHLSAVHTGMRVILASGDVERLRSLTPALCREGLTVTAVTDGREVLARPQRSDAYILDAALPPAEGTWLCRTLRQSGCTSQPIVLLTAGPGDPQTEEAYLSGADDCVPRTISARQLAVRLHAIRRRSQAQTECAPAAITVGDLTVDTEAHLAHWRGAAIALSRTELRLLYILALNAGQVISSDRLLEYGLGSAHVGRGPRGKALLLAAHVARMRRKLSLPARGAGAIVAQPGLGYRLEGPGPAVTRRPAAGTGPVLVWRQPLAS